MKLLHRFLWEPNPELEIWRDVLGLALCLAALVWVCFKVWG